MDSYRHWKHNQVIRYHDVGELFQDGLREVRMVRIPEGVS